jgi:hypothetical protein
MLMISRGVWFRGLQIFAVLAVYAAWHYTQHLLESSRGLITNVADHTHEALAAVNVFFNAHPAITNAVLIVTSFELDVAALSMVAFFFVRKESRPLLGLWLVLLLRQLCQASVSMPKPDGLLWHYPGFPSLVVTYGASSDFFFSGHMALSTLFAMELSIQGAKRWKQIVAWGAIGLHVFVILSMRFHYVQDVVAGFLAAIVAALVARAVGRRLDERVAGWFAPWNRATVSPAAVGEVSVAGK